MIKDIHPHFLCISCRELTCTLDSSSSENYRIEGVEVIIRGICPSCNK